MDYSFEKQEKDESNYYLVDWKHFFVQKRHSLFQPKLLTKLDSPSKR